MTAKNRDNEYVAETIRKNMQNQMALMHSSKVNPASRLVRIVDREALIKCRLKQIGNWEQAHTIFEKGDQYIKYEKDREKAHTNGQCGAFHIGDLPVGITIEGIYYDVYGEGFDGTDIPPRIGENYDCYKCFHKFKMGPAQLPLKCGCGTLTPLGRLVQDGYLRR